MGLKPMNLLKSSAWAFLSAALLSCENNLERVSVISNKEDFPSISAWDFSFLYNDSASIVLNVKAPQLHSFADAPEPYTEFPEGINLVYFSVFPDTNSMITANYAIRYDKDMRWEATGNVVAKNAEGDVLNTEFMVWDEKKEIIFSDKYVTIKSKDDIIEGVGFEADQTFTKWKITKVTGIITIDENDD
jgi:LPS export ABC transporter protein LptC